MVEKGLGMAVGTLADYLWGNKSNEFSGFYGQASTDAYSLTTDSAGKTRIPTLADVGAASKPEDKLKLLQQMADVVSVQADAGIATGRADGVPGMTKSAKEMLSALKTVVDGLKTTDGSVADGAADPALKDYRSQIAGALTSLRNAMDKVGTLTARASSEVASQTASDLAALDDQAGSLATLAGGTWRRSGTNFRADPSKLVDILV
ncbi:MAG TPA: hypothetical protein VK196_16720 [Magnetospirillum sp.]|nr:hypothetical protein [Magnetospirillum sp.]